MQHNLIVFKDGDTHYLVIESDGAETVKRISSYLYKMLLEELG